MYMLSLPDDCFTSFRKKLTETRFTGLRRSILWEPLSNVYSLVQDMVCGHKKNPCLTRINSPESEILDDDYPWKWCHCFSFEIQRGTSADSGNIGQNASGQKVKKAMSGANSMKTSAESC